MLLLVAQGSERDQGTLHMAMPQICESCQHRMLLKISLNLQLLAIFVRVTYQRVADVVHLLLVRLVVHVLQHR
jgi:hypothetical protein